ncbi:DL-endopeptidase inhibitor IseA family protein [Paenibacillus dauci]|uniref:DL-endopeptidase inhibitor IseA family protein n=1 Tax=Paenibacillus dauci TaxID=1567106 RepID=UPI0006972B07|nr:DL-endopeptidase inhibitor IseA family protein [Paenibacillus dauci]
MNWTKPTATTLLMTAVVSASLYSGAPASAASTTAPTAKSNAASTSASSSKSTTSSTASAPSGAKTSNSSTKSTTTSTKSTKNDQTNSAKADKNSSSKASSAAKAGTKGSSKAAASSKSNNNTQSAAAAAGATTATGSTYAAWTGVSKLNHETVIPLIVEAQKRYTYTTSGGASSTAAGTFTLSGQTYRYLSQDIGTRSKLLAYLMETYTKQASETFIQKNFVQNNGKMAQLQADGGSLLEFDRATAKMISMTDTSRVYRLTVPYVDNAQPVERVMVKFALVDGQWKINTAPHVLF